MRKIIAIAFILFMFASTTNALAGDKRFCGWVATPSTNSAIGAGAWFDKDWIAYNKACGEAVKEAKKGLKDAGRWEGNDWKKKDGYKCGHISDFFTNGRNMCGKKGYMRKDKTGYLIIKTSQGLTFEKL